MGGINPVPNSSFLIFNCLLPAICLNVFNAELFQIGYLPGKVCEKVCGFHFGFHQAAIGGAMRALLLVIGLRGRSVADQSHVMAKFVAQNGSLNLRA